MIVLCMLHTLANFQGIFAKGLSKPEDFVVAVKIEQIFKTLSLPSYEGAKTSQNSQLFLTGYLKVPC